MHFSMIIKNYRLFALVKGFAEIEKWREEIL